MILISNETCGFRFGSTVRCVVVVIKVKYLGFKTVVTGL